VKSEFKLELLNNIPLAMRESSARQAFNKT